jgi:hypothetical protein
MKRDAAGSFSAIMRFYNGVDLSIIFLDYINDGGVYKWRLRLTESATEDTYPQTISVDTWYCLEILYDSTNDLHKLWVDGAERISFSAFVTGAMDRFSVGYPSGGWWSHNEYVDCVVVADAYIGPEEAALVSVTDSLELEETILRGKTLLLSDSLELADALYGNKSLLLNDSASLSEIATVLISEITKYITDSVGVADLTAALKTLKTLDALTLVDAASTPSRVLQALDAFGLTDDSYVNKTLQINETISLVEVVETGAVGVKKTRLFLIIGDLAVQLTGN